MIVEGTQINPKITLATKAKLQEFCKARGHSQGDVVEAALEAYLTPTDGDAQALLFQKVTDLGQGMEAVVTLLGTVITHLEQQAKPPAPKIATRAELYPELAVVPEAPAPIVMPESPRPPRSFWQAVFGRKALA